MNDEKENAAAKAAEALNAAKLKRRADLDTFGRNLEGKSETDWQQAVKVNTTFYGESSGHVNQINGFVDAASVYKCFALDGAKNSEVLAHSYNGGYMFNSASFRIPMPNGSSLRQRVCDNLGILSDSLNQQEFVVTIQCPNYLQPDNTDILFRPQWVFEKYYDGTSDGLAVYSGIETKVQVFSNNSKTEAFSTVGNAVSWHPFSGDDQISRNYQTGVEFDRRAVRAISDPTHSLGFSNVDILNGETKVVLSNVKFLGEPVAEEVKTSLNIVLSPTAADEFLKLSSPDENFHSRKLTSNRSIGEIFRGLYKKDHISRDVLDLLAIPVA